MISAYQRDFGTFSLRIGYFSICVDSPWGQAYRMIYQWGYPDLFNVCFFNTGGKPCVLIAHCYKKKENYSSPFVLFYFWVLMTTLTIYATVLCSIDTIALQAFKSLRLFNPHEDFFLLNLVSDYQRLL